MINKLKTWFTRFKPVDTTPEQFEIWFRKKLGERLQGGDSYFAICIKGRPHVPRIGKDFKVYDDVNKAQKEMKRLQEGCEYVLELRVVRVYYSVVSV